MATDFEPKAMTAYIIGCFHLLMLQIKTLGLNPST